jgi:hypothetical protein
MSGIAMQTSKFSPMVLGVFLLAACNQSSNNSPENSDADSVQAEANDGKIECALAGSNKFARACDTEHIAGPSGQMLVIRHPDGGFRRFKVLTDGRGLAAAEGADQTTIKILNDGAIELSSGDDLYHLPAQIKSPATIQNNSSAASAEETAKTTAIKVAG